MNQDKTLANPTWKKSFWVIELAFISGLIIYTLSILSKCLTIPWIWNSDEVVYTAEVIKFLRLNFNQNFFDIPGTPFMFLTAILWAVWYGILSLSGLIPHDLSIKLFTFQNLNQFYFLMRFLVLGFYALSIVLIYILGKRLTNAIGGCIAALLLALSFYYTSYSCFVRTESLGICLSLTALLLTLNAIEQNKPKQYFFSGFCSGVATAARYHFVLATLPQIFTFYFLKEKPENRQFSPRLVRWIMIFASAIGVLFIVGGILALLLNCQLISPNWITDRLLLSPIDPGLPKALQLIHKLWISLGVLAVVLFFTAYIPRLQKWNQKLVQPALVLVFLGFGIGLVLGTPTFLWRGYYLLRSIQFYSDWIDYERLKLSPIGQYLDMLGSYWNVIAPTPALAVLLVAGIGLIVLRRDRNLYPALLGIITLFIAQPVLLPSAYHRSLPWLPYVALVTAYPFAFCYQWWSKTNQQKIAIQFITFCSLLAVSLSLVGFGLVPNGAYQQSSMTLDQLVIPRLEAVDRASNWIKQHTESDAIVMVNYYGFNEQIYYASMEAQGVKLPKKLKEARSYMVWWGDRTPLQDKSGYLMFVCSTASCKSEAESAQKYFNERKGNGEGVNPFTHPNFIKLAASSKNGYEMNIFKFNFKLSTTANQKKRQ
ncbi:MAG TPA: glycosyltransferase family 39 protein [Microcoleaceae cyanobacterium]